MRRYAVDVRCPRCGGELAHVTSSKVYADTECSAIARCEPCRREWQLQVVLRECPRFTRGAA